MQGGAGRSVKQDALLQLAFLLGVFLISSESTNCQACPSNAIRVPEQSIGTSSAFTLKDGLRLHHSAAAGPRQSFCCPRGQIKSWTTSAGKFGFLGEISATCTDDSVLPDITMGFNGTGQPECPANLSHPVISRNPSSGVFKYKSGLILDAFLEGSKTFTCGKQNVPIGYRASSSCLALTSFQVICGPGKPSPEVCPRATQRVPSIPLGSIGAFDLMKAAEEGGNKTAVKSAKAGEQQTRCCSAGQIKSWTVAKSKASKFVGSIAVSCTDGSQLPALTLGFNGSDQVKCNSSLMDAKTILDPKDGIYTFRNGLVLDSFLDDSANHDMLSCGSGLQAVGFAASSSCFALTNLQLLCGPPTLSLRSIAEERISIATIAGGVAGLAAAALALSILYNWHKQRAKGFMRLPYSDDLNGGINSW